MASPKRLMNPKKYSQIQEILGDIHKQMRSWDQLLEEITLPAVMSIAITTGRTDLLRAKHPEVKPEDLTVEKYQGMLHALGVLIETNAILRKHAETLSIYAEDLWRSIQGVQKQLQTLRDFADFRDPVAEEEED